MIKIAIVKKSVVKSVPRWLSEMIIISISETYKGTYLLTILHMKRIFFLRLSFAKAHQVVYPRIFFSCSYSSILLRHYERA